MLINIVKMNGKLEKVIHDKSLIDFVYDECMDFHHVIFESSPNLCSKSNFIEKENKDKMLLTEGEFTIVEVPGGFDPFSVVIAIVVAIVAAALVYSLLSVDIDNPGTGTNNQISGRQNKERPLERIEDIAGTVRSYPTLIAQPYKVFTGIETEVEYSLMCVGVGEYDISKSREGDTLGSSIAGFGACYYGPYRKPSVDTPFRIDGTQFTEELRTFIESTEVSNEALDYEGSAEVQLDAGDSEYTYDSGTGEGTITWTGSSFSLPFDEIYDLYQDALDESADLTFALDATFDNGGSSDSLSGTYLITGMTNSLGDSSITFLASTGDDVAVENSNWSLITSATENDTTTTISPAGEETSKIVGPFFLSREERTGFQVNVTAQGLRTDKKHSLQINFYIEYAQADEDGNRIGEWTRYSTYIRANTPNRVGKSIEITTPFTGPCLIRAERTTGDTDNGYQNIILEYLYSIEPMDIENFGNVTTVQVKTTANARSSAISNRKFNCIASRKIQNLNSDGTLGEIAATNRFIDYFAYATLDENIGRRSEDELDGEALIEAYNDIAAHFGTEEACQFNYTFDNDELSLQDVLQYTANAAFAYAVRKNGVFSVRPEIPRDPETMFSSRNKISDNQKISLTLPSEEDKDGIKYSYVDPDTSGTITITIPEDRVPVRPEKYESVGVRNHNQAWWQAWRRFYELRSKRISIQDTLTADGALISVNDVISISNDTLAPAASGEVISVTGLMVELSQPVEFGEDADHSIAFRLRDGTIETIGCSEGPQANIVILDNAPSEELYTDYDEERTSFIFNRDDVSNFFDIIVSSVDRSNPLEIGIEGVNYSEQYFSKDGEISPYN